MVVVVSKQMISLPKFHFMKFHFMQKKPFCFRNIMGLWGNKSKCPFSEGGNRFVNAAANSLETKYNYCHTNLVVIS